MMREASHSATISGLPEMKAEEVTRVQERVDSVRQRAPLRAGPWQTKLQPPEQNEPGSSAEDEKPESKLEMKGRAPVERKSRTIEEIQAALKLNPAGAELTALLQELAAIRRNEGKLAKNPPPPPTQPPASAPPPPTPPSEPAAPSDALKEATAAAAAKNPAPAPFPRRR